MSDDRGPENSSVSCRCNKASRLSESLQLLGRRLSEASQVAERVGQLPTGMEDKLQIDIDNVADILRAEVSILIPNGVGSADPEVSEQAAWLLSEGGDISNVMEETVEGLTRIVTVLMGVEECLHHGDTAPMEEEIDQDIRDMVASMCGGSISERRENNESEARVKDFGKQVLEKSRKRKQARPSRSLSSGGLASAWGSGVNLSSPVKRVKRVMTSLGTSYNVPNPMESGDQGGQVLSLLETKKKLVKKDGLYKFVLWREALRDEKTKLVT